MITSTTLSFLIGYVLSDPVKGLRYAEVAY